MRRISCAGTEVQTADQWSKLAESVSTQLPTPMTMRQADRTCGNEIARPTHIPLSNPCLDRMSTCPTDLQVRPYGRQLAWDRCFFLRERNPQLSAINDGGWEKITLIVDSGASEIRHSSKVGTEYEVADGGAAKK